MVANLTPLAAPYPKGSIGHAFTVRVSTIRRANIEGVRSNIAMNAWLSTTKVPRRNSSETSSGIPMRAVERGTEKERKKGRRKRERQNARRKEGEGDRPGQRERQEGSRGACNAMPLLTGDGGRLPGQREEKTKGDPGQPQEEDEERRRE